MSNEPKQPLEDFQRMRLKIKIENELARHYYEKAMNDEQENRDNDDCGFDLYFIEDTIIPAGETRLVNFGIACEADFIAPRGSLGLYRNTGFMMVPRSSIYKTPVRMANNIGIIDPSYRGTLRVPLDNITDDDYTISRGQRLFQLIAFNGIRPKIRLVEQLTETKRGTGGFGSTGTHNLEGHQATTTTVLDNKFGPVKELATSDLRLK